MALGKQYVDIWKNSNELGKAAGQAALSLCSSPDFSKIAVNVDPSVAPAAGNAPADFTTPGGKTVKSIILKPTPITADKLGDVDGQGLVCHQGPDLQGRQGRRSGRGSLQVTVSDLLALANACALGSAPGRRCVSSPRTRRVGGDERGRRDAVPGQTQPPARTSIRGLFAQTEIDLRLFGMLVALVVILLTFHVLSGGKLISPTNMVTMAVQATGIAIIATGMVLVIVSRNIDLSVGSLAGLTAMVYALLMTNWLDGDRDRG